MSADQLFTTGVARRSDPTGDTDGTAPLGVAVPGTRDPAFRNPSFRDPAIPDPRIPAGATVTDSTVADATRMVRIIRDSFAVVAPRAAEVAQYFYGLLFSTAPATRDLFPANLSVQRSRLLRALVHVVQMVDQPDDLVPFLAQLGRDHRKFGIIAQHYDAFGAALLGALAHYAGESWTPSVQQAWTDAYGIVALAMREAAEGDQGPGPWSATVVEHRRLSWDLAVVRLQPTEPVPYAAGQYVSIETPQRPRLWRYLSPATAPRADGLLEFHVRAVEGGWVSRAIVAHSQVGDTWRIGPPMGRMTVDGGNIGSDLLMVAGGTGVAPIRAMCEELAGWGVTPLTHVYVGGRTADDLYALDMLGEIAATNPWLTVTPVAEDPLVIGAKHGTLADVVTSNGHWPDRDVLVCGSPAMIRATVSQLLVAGTPLGRIRYDPFTLD